MYLVDIDGFETRDFGRTFFRINVAQGDRPEDSWTIFRRYSEFVVLRNSLQILHPHRVVPDLPSNTVLSYFAGDEFLYSRAEGLLRFLRGVLQELEPDPKSACLREFLRIYRPCAPNISLRDSSSGSTGIERGTRFSEDLVQQILCYFDATEIVKLSRVSRVWYFASLSPNLWNRIRLVTPKFERIQHGFLSLVDRLSTEASGVLESAVFHAQYSSRETVNVRVTLPENTLFYKLQSLDFSTLYPPSDPRTSSENLLVEIFDSIISNPDTVCLKSVTVTSNLNAEILRSLLSVSTFIPLTHLKLIFLKADHMDQETHSLLYSLIERSASTLETLEIRVSYPEPSLGAVPDFFAGERTSSYPANTSLLNLLPTMTRLRKLHYDFFPKNFVHYDSDILRLPPNLEDLDIRFVVPSIGDGRDLSVSDRRSLMLEVFRAVPACIRKIRLRTIGVDETQMMNHTEFLPYMFSPPQQTFDLLLPQLMSSEWTNKFNNLESLELEGPQLVHGGFWRYLVDNDENVGRFWSLFPRLKKLVIVNCISEFSENFVTQTIMRLGRLQILDLGGFNEKFTDNFLLKLADQNREPELFSRIWNTSFRSLTIPTTRYMSPIGIAALQHALSKNKRVGITLEDPERITGRDKLVDEMENRGEKFIFTRF